MKTLVIWLIAGVLAAGVVYGQQKSRAQVEVLTVCEMLAEVDRYADNAIVAVGRMERSVSLKDHAEFLSQDECQHPVITNGHVWSNKIQVWVGWDTGMPKPPSDSIRPDRSVLAAKLRVIRRTTSLGSHEAPQFKTDGRTLVYEKMAAKPNEWAAVYGWIVRAPNLNEDCGTEVCGGHNVPLVIVAEPSNVHKLGEDGRLLPERR